MEKAKAVRAKTRDVLIVNKMLSLESEVVIFFPVPADGQNIIGSFD